MATILPTQVPLSATDAATPRLVNLQDYREPCPLLSLVPANRRPDGFDEV